MVPCPKDFQARCGLDGECVNISAICDGKADCSDGIDESPEVCCYQDQFRCPLTREKYPQGVGTAIQAGITDCLHPMFVCDDVPDCPGGEDENVDTCKGQTDPPVATTTTEPMQCTESNHTYASEQCGCIPHRFICDGESDCLDHADEANCQLGEYNELLCNGLTITPINGFQLSSPSMQLAALGN